MRYNKVRTTSMHIDCIAIDPCYWPMKHKIYHRCKCFLWYLWPHSGTSDHISIQATTPNLGKNTSETSFSHSRVFFVAYCYEWDLQNWGSMVTCRELSKQLLTAAKHKTDLRRSGGDFSQLVDGWIRRTSGDISARRAGHSYGGVTVTNSLSQAHPIHTQCCRWLEFT